MEGIKSFKKLKEGEYDKEIIGSDNEHVSKIYIVKKDDDDKSQGGVVSLVVCAFNSSSRVQRGICGMGWVRQHNFRHGCKISP